jgi:protein ImuA
VRLDALVERVRLAEGRAGKSDRARPAAVTTGWAAIDCAFSAATPGVPVGVAHEWFAAGGPPLRVLLHLAASACRASGDEGGGGLSVWVGRQCWPYPRRLDPDLLGGAVFVDPPRPADRLWAAELCARSPAVAAVVADGSGFDMTATRRLQLAARDGPGLLLLARPLADLRRPSAAAVRWRAEPAVSPTDHPRWTVELLRCKGVRPTDAGPLRWALEGTDGSAVVLVPADVADRPAAAAAGAGGWKIA